MRHAQLALLLTVALAASAGVSVSAAQHRHPIDHDGRTGASPNTAAARTTRGITVATAGVRQLPAR